MKNIFNSYPLVLLGETIGAKETLSKEKRYENLSRSFKVLSTGKTDEEIWEFYQWRKISYGRIRLFASFILIFLTFMAFILTGAWIAVISVGLPFLVVYGFIGVTVKPERKYAHLWDNKSLFMEFLKLNRTESFNPINFDQYLGFNKDALVYQEPNFQEELRILKNETNRFNSVKMETVIHFFDIMRENADYPEELKCVQISDKDFIRFIKARFVDKSDLKLDIEGGKKNKSNIKALFTKCSPCKFVGIRLRYIGLYLKVIRNKICIFCSG